MIPEQFTAWMKRLGYNQVRAAEAIGTTRQSVAKMSRGEMPVSRTVALACSAIAYGLPPMGDTKI